MTNKKKYFRFVFCGDACVGKSVLIHRFKEKEFNEYQGATIGAVFHLSSLKVDGDVHKFQIW